MILCQNKIYPDPKEDRLYTYCMRLRGHKGKCDVKAHPEDKEQKDELSDTPRK